MLFESRIEELLSLLPWVRARHEQKALRPVVEQQRRLLTAKQVAEQSALIVARIEQMPAFREAHTVLLYYPIHNEVDLRPLLTKYADQKMFLFPSTHRRSMEARPYEGEGTMRKGRFGVPEPQSAAYRGEIDLILVPGVAFDRHGHRIGRGGGYYDKFLSRYPHATKVGVGYDFQLRKQDLPHTIRDKKVNYVVTPQQTIG